MPGPFDGWYKIRVGALVVYVSDDGRYLFQGDLIDLDANVNLTDVDRNDARIEMMAAIPDSDKIRFAPDEPKYKVVIFTDIDCTYCRRMHAQIDDYMDRGIEVQYLLYPRNGPASPSWTKAERVWCSNDRNKALTLAKLDQSFQSSACDSSVVSEHYGIGRDINLSGTPAIVLPNGQMIPGYVEADRLAEQLEFSSKAAAAAEGD